MKRIRKPTLTKRKKQRMLPIPFRAPPIVRSLLYNTDIKYKDGAIRFTPTLGGGSAGLNGIDGASAGLFGLVNGMNLGSNDGQRIGRKLTMRNLSFQWNFTTFSEPAGLHNKVQWGFIYEKGTDATFAVFSDVFDMTAANKVENTLKPDSMHKYKILYRNFLELPAFSEKGAFNQPKEMGSGYLNWKGKKKGGLSVQFYKTDNGNFEDIQDGALYVYYLTDLANTKYYLDVHYRIAYSDI